jgi:hypothetical protein
VKDRRGIYRDVVNVLDKEEGVDRDLALLIADGVFNRLRGSDIRE